MQKKMLHPSGDEEWSKQYVRNLLVILLQNDDRFSQKMNLISKLSVGFLHHRKSKYQSFIPAPQGLSQSYTSFVDICKYYMIVFMLISHSHVRYLYINIQLLQYFIFSKNMISYSCLQKVSEGKSMERKYHANTRVRECSRNRSSYVL